MNIDEHTFVYSLCNIPWLSLPCNSRCLLHPEHWNYKSNHSQMSKISYLRVRCHRRGRRGLACRSDSETSNIQSEYLCGIYLSRQI
jgi:hypothetical protein